jgi:NADPH:quinone reductase-like Zn-dependent oxidoreductase
MAQPELYEDLVHGSGVMKAICLRVRGGPEAFAYEEAPQPRPGEGEVLVRVHAAGVMHTELGWDQTWTTPTGEPRPWPVILGHEFSGEITALGTGVRDVGVGDLVYGLNDWNRNGAYAEYCAARVDNLAHKPANVDHVHAAATPIAALTAWQGLVERAGLAAGQHVLIHGAAGGVGTFAVQLARWRGARVTATASTANLDFVRRLGADEVIDYRAQRFDDVVGGMGGVDVVFDTVGGQTLDRSWGVLKPGGRLVTVADPGETTDERSRAAYFIVEPNRTQLAEIARLIETGALRPVVGAVFPLAEARQAYQHKPNHGKVVLRVIDGGGAA